MTGTAARLSATLRADARLQWRYGFYAAGAFVAAIWIGVLSALPTESVRIAIPALLFLNGMITTFFFVAGLVLFEKREGVLEALVVTPLRPSEYLAAKVATLGALATLETFAIVALGWSPDLRWGPVLLGVVGVGTVYTLTGLWLVFRYDSINEFLMPGALVSGILQLPFLASLGVWRPAVFWLWPTWGPLLFIEAGFASLDPGHWLFAVISTGVWIGLLWVVVVRAFHRFVLRREGVRP